MNPLTKVKLPRPSFNLLLLLVLLTISAFATSLRAEVSPKERADVLRIFSSTAEFTPDELVTFIRAHQDAFVLLAREDQNREIFGGKIAAMLSPNAGVEGAPVIQRKTLISQFVKAFENNYVVMRALLSIRQVDEAMGVRKLARIFYAHPAVEDSLDHRTPIIRSAGQLAAYMRERTNGNRGKLPHSGSPEWKELCRQLNIEIGESE